MIFANAYKGALHLPSRDLIPSLASCTHTPLTMNGPGTTPLRPTMSLLVSLRIKHMITVYQSNSTALYITQGHPMIRLSAPRALTTSNTTKFVSSSRTQISSPQTTYRSPVAGFSIQRGISGWLKLASPSSI